MGQVFRGTITLSSNVVIDDNAKLIEFRVKWPRRIVRGIEDS